MKNVTITGPADLDDQRWLDDQIEAIEVGFEAVVNIARNWTDLRNLARLHPGVSPAEYVIAHVGVLGKAVVPVLLAESNWSNRQIATVAGVDHETVNRIARTGANAPDERQTLGADSRVRTYAPRTVTAVVIDTPMEPDDVPDHRVQGDAHRVGESADLRAITNPTMIEHSRPMTGRRTPTRELVVRWTSWYLEAVDNYALRRDPRLREQYGEAIALLRAAILPDLIHRAEHEVASARRALDRSTVPGVERSRAQAKLANAEQKFAGIAGRARHDADIPLVGTTAQAQP
jgi:hypothetical protein